MTDLTPETLRQLLRYEPNTGRMFWLPRPVSMFRDGLQSASQNQAAWNGRYAATEAFAALDGKGYLSGKIFGRRYSAHRVIWAIMTGAWPDDEIDHINGVRTHNYWTNLREATVSENRRNVGMRAGNTSGVKGVYWHKAARKWVAQIMVDKRHRHLGYFLEITDAAAAYAKASEELHGEFGRTA